MHPFLYVHISSYNEFSFTLVTLYPLFGAFQFDGVILYFGKSYMNIFMYPKPKYSCVILYPSLCLSLSLSSLSIPDLTGFTQKSIECVWFAFYWVRSAPYIKRYLHSFVHSMTVAYVNFRSAHCYQMWTLNNFGHILIKITKLFCVLGFRSAHNQLGKFMPFTSARITDVYLAFY